MTSDKRPLLLKALRRRPRESVREAALAPTLGLPETAPAADPPPEHAAPSPPLTAPPTAPRPDALTASKPAPTMSATPSSGPELAGEARLEAPAIFREREAAVLAAAMIMNLRESENGGETEADPPPLVAGERPPDAPTPGNGAATAALARRDGGALEPRLVPDTPVFRAAESAEAPAAPGSPAAPEPAAMRVAPLIEVRREFSWLRAGPAQIRELVHTVHRAATEAAGDGLVDGAAEAEFTVVLHCADKSRVVLDDPKALEDDNLLQDKSVHRVQIGYLNPALRQRIAVSIEDTREEMAALLNNTVTVSSLERPWSERVIQRIEVALGACEPQPQWLQRWRWLFALGFALMIGGPLVFIGWLFGQDFVSVIDPPADLLQSNAYLFLAGGFYLSAAGLIGAIPGERLSYWLAALFPCVEVTTGPRLETRARRRTIGLAAIATVLALPAAATIAVRGSDIATAWLAPILGL